MDKISYAERMRLNGQRALQSYKREIVHKYNFTQNGSYYNTDVYILGNYLGRCQNGKHSHQRIRGLVSDFYDEQKTFLFPMYVCVHCGQICVDPEDARKYRDQNKTPCLKYSLAHHTVYHPAGRHGVIASRKHDFTENTYSIPYMFGYTVGKTKNLSSEERQLILHKICEHGFMKSIHVLDYLEGNRSLRESDSKFYDAVDKWDEDWSYVYDNIFSVKPRF